VGRPGRSHFVFAKEKGPETKGKKKKPGALGKKGEDPVQRATASKDEVFSEGGKGRHS